MSYRQYQSTCLQISQLVTCLVHTWHTWNHRKLCWHASWFLRVSWEPGASQHGSIEGKTLEHGFYHVFRCVKFNSTFKWPIW